MHSLTLQKFMNFSVANLGSKMVLEMWCINEGSVLKVRRLQCEGWITTPILYSFQ